MDELWGPALKIVVEAGKLNLPAGQQISEDAIVSISEAMKAMPRAIHAHFLSTDALLWSSLQPGGLTIPISDLTLKYGGTVSGLWNLLYILDAWPDAGQAPDVVNWSGGAMIDSILQAMHGLRTIMGRPANWTGITPLMIYRSTSGWRPRIAEEAATASKDLGVQVESAKDNT